jgi:hypothetical protein
LCKAVADAQERGADRKAKAKLWSLQS